MAALAAGVANAFTVDVEDYYQVEAFARTVRREDWEAFPSRVVRNTEVLLDMLARHGVRGTFFVLGWVAERHPELVKKIAQAGHEVASHGFSHNMITRQTPGVFRGETRRSKALLEDLAQRPVIGYRAATYSITPKTVWALDILAEEGFQYDSSVFPIRHDRYGIVDAPRLPYVAQCRNGMRITEFPISTARLFGANLPIAGGGYFRLLPYALSAAGLRGVNAEGAPFVFYLHPWEVDPAQPRMRAGLLSQFRHRVGLAGCAAKLERLLSDFRFTTAAEVLAGVPTQSMGHFEHAWEEEALADA